MTVITLVTELIVGERALRRRDSRGLRQALMQKTQVKGFDEDLQPGESRKDLLERGMFRTQDNETREI
jgi:hypothetical protein